MKEKRQHILYNLLPVFVLVVILLVFAILTKGSILSAYTVKSLLQKVVVIIISGLGMLFVISQGSIDMSVGSIMGITSILSVMISNRIGFWAFFPVALGVGFLIGMITGFLVAKFKVSSFMVTFAMMMIWRAVCTAILGDKGTFVCLPQVIKLTTMPVLVPILAGTILLIVYVFEYTRFGYYCKGIGENETACRYVGVPVDRIKILAFAISGMMAGFAGAFISSRAYGTNLSVGSSLELSVMMAIFLGGVLVSGGMQSRVYKVLIGAITIGILEISLNILGVNTALNEIVRGGVLILVIFISMFFNNSINQLQGNKAITRL